MKAFDVWWNEVLIELDKSRNVRNWTAKEGYSISGKFLAVSYRSLPKDFQSRLNNGYPYNNPDEWIVCSMLQSKRLTTVSKKQFQDRYWKWIDYRNDGMTRKAFAGEGGGASPYLIAIFKEFNALI